MEHASFWKEFFEIYKDLPALWHVKSTEYTDRNLKAKCYMKLIRKLKEIYPNADREMAVRKINNFRTSYRKELKRIRDCRLMGKTYKPTLWYFDYLNFLNDQDEGWSSEKCTNQIQQTEVKIQGSRDVVIKRQVVRQSVTATKRGGDLKDTEDECLPKPSQRRKLRHHFHKKLPKTPTFAKQQEVNGDAEILAKAKEMKEDQKLIGRKLISDILFYGCLGTLGMSHAIDLQKIFIRVPKNPEQQFNLSPQSTVESNSSLHFAEQEYFNYDSIRESPIEFNSCSPSNSPTTNSIAKLQVNDIKLEGL